MKKRYLSLLCSILAVSAHAQTYSHDDPKMKQITVQEIGSGALTPDAYYWALHNSYKKTAAQKNKLSYRTAAGIAAYQQVDDAEKLDSAMVKRAEVEALNVADRTGTALELAWGVEGSKVTSKLETFETNIRRILQAGGTAVDQRYWQEQAALFKKPSKIKGFRRFFIFTKKQKKREIANFHNRSTNLFVIIDNKSERCIILLSNFNNLVKGAVHGNARN